MVLPILTDAWVSLNYMSITIHIAFPGTLSHGAACRAELALVLSTSFLQQRGYPFPHAESLPPPGDLPWTSQSFRLSTVTGWGTIPRRQEIPEISGNGSHHEA